MKLTTKGRYAVTAMLDLAVHQEAGTVALADISQRQDISLSYLEQLFSRLRKRGLVQSTRGPGGGYQLGLNANDISVAAIIHAVDEDVDVTRCQGNENCQNNMRCLTHDLWSDLTNKIRDYLEGITLGQLKDQRQVNTICERQDVILQQRRCDTKPALS